MALTRNVGLRILRPSYLSPPYASRSITLPLRNSFYRLRSSYTAVPKSDETCSLSQEGVKEKVLPFSDIPGPKTHWFIWTIKLFLAPGGPFKVFYKHYEDVVSQYGPVVKQKDGNGTNILVASPEDAAAVFRADPKYPIRANPGDIFDYLRERIKRPPGVFFADGTEWYKHRSVLSKRMLKPPEINKYIPRLNDIVSDAILEIKRLRNNVEGEKAYEIDNLDMLLFRWSFESVTDVLFDRRFHTLSENPSKESLDFILNVGTFLKHAVPALIIPLSVHKVYETQVFKELERSFKKLYYYAELFTTQKLKELDKNVKTEGINLEKDDIQEFIPFILSRGKVADHELQSSIVDTFFAGVDTTSNTMQWMLYLLAKNPDAQKYLREEIDSVNGMHNIPDAQALKQMPFLRAVIKETLRLYPVLILHRRLLHEDLVLSEIRNCFSEIMNGLSPQN